MFFSSRLSTWKNLGVLAALLLFSLALAPTLHAVPYNGEKAYAYHQPDGSTFPVKLYGDEFFAYQRTLEGREIVEDPGTGFWCYAALAADGRSFISTGVPVATAAKGFVPAARAAAPATGFAPAWQTLPSDIVIARVRAAQAKFHVNEKGQRLRSAVPGGKPLAAPPSHTTTGSKKGLCLLVDFSDSVGSISQSQVDNFCNQASGYTEFNNACSVRQYFQIQSNTLLDYTNVVTVYIRAPKTKAYYDNNSTQNWGSSTAQELVADALDGLIGTGFDFSQLSLDSSGNIISLNIFYAGTCTSGWSKGLWPHSWAIPTKTVATGIYAQNYQMSDMKTSLEIGTFCHENGHMTCDYPDLYSYVGSTPGIVGDYSLMSGGSWGGGDGSHPTNIDPYLKIKSGWATPTVVNSSTGLNTSLPATSNTFIKYPNPADSREYFLLENRNNSGYEGVFGGSPVSVCPGRGLVVWQIFEGGDNTYSSIQQSGTYTVPYEAMIVEATPTLSYSPWYSNPNPDANFADTFYQGHGANPLNDASDPNLNFWDHAGNTGRTVPSGMVIQNIGTPGSSISLTLGSTVVAILGTITPPEAVAAGAKWRRTGTSTWLDSGYTESGLATGTYTVEFKDIAGWVTPSTQTFSLSLGQTANITGNYTSIAANFTMLLDGAPIANGASIDFGSAYLNAPSVSKTITIRNISLSSLTLSGLTLPDGYQMSGTFPDSIPVGGSATFSVEMQTDNPGYFNGTLKFTSNASDKSTVILPLTGSVLPVSTGANTATYKITYKNCSVTVLTSDTLAQLQVSGSPNATLKIQRYDTPPARLSESKSVKVLYDCVAITSISVTNGMGNLNTNAPILKISVDGVLGTLQSTNAFIGTVQASAFKNVTITRTPTADSSSSPRQTRLLATNTGATSIKPKVTLTGIGLAQFSAPSLTATISVNSKKNAAGIAPADLSGSLKAGPALSLTVNGGNATGDILAASIKSLSVKAAAGMGGHLGMDNEGTSIATWIMTGVPGLGTATPDIQSVSAAAGIDAVFVCGIAPSTADLSNIVPSFLGSLKKISLGATATLSGTFWSKESAAGTTPKINPKTVDPSGFQAMTSEDLVGGVIPGR